MSVDGVTLDELCAERFTILLGEISEGTTRYRAATRLREIIGEIHIFAAECNPWAAEVLEWKAKLALKGTTVSEAVGALQRVAECAEAPLVARQHALSDSARLLLYSEPWDQNEQRRSAALQIAQADGQRFDEAAILANWSSALMHVERFAAAADMLSQAEGAFRRLDRKESREYSELESFLEAQRAKLAFVAASQTASASERTALVQTGIGGYATAIAIAHEDDHRRANLQVELVELLLETASRANDHELTLAEESLEEARISTNAHTCNLCPAYFHHVESQLLREKALRVRQKSPPKALRFLHRAAESVSTAVALYAEEGHGGLNWSRKLQQDIQLLIGQMLRPNRVFLSHTGVDKPMVRRYRDVLRELRYDPWLDEDAMAAGVPLDRAILQGLRDSCAAVFFVTPSFQDRTFVSQEIDYAIAEKRVKGDQFAIVTLVLSSEGSRGVVPDLLKRFVWKEPASELEALQEVIRALPMRPSAPHWTDE